MSRAAWCPTSGGCCGRTAPSLLVGHSPDPRTPTCDLPDWGPGSAYLADHWRQRALGPDACVLRFASATSHPSSHPVRRRPTHRGAGVVHGVQVERATTDPRPGTAPPPSRCRPIPRRWHCSGVHLLDSTQLPRTRPRRPAWFGGVPSRRAPAFGSKRLLGPWRIMRTALGAAPYLQVGPGGVGHGWGIRLGPVHRPLVGRSVKRGSSRGIVSGAGPRPGRRGPKAGAEPRVPSPAPARSAGLWGVILRSDGREAIGSARPDGRRLRAPAPWTADAVGRWPRG